MQLDLRYPIGLLLVTYGVMLALQGAIVGATVLGLNVNPVLGRADGSVRHRRSVVGPPERATAT